MGMRVPEIVSVNSLPFVAGALTPILAAEPDVNGFGWLLADFVFKAVLGGLIGTTTRHVATQTLKFLKRRYGKRFGRCGNKRPPKAPTQ